ncbi:MAG: DUF4382 domain-containing protein [Bacteroidota bacterium]|nr:DUF4382 domain-containing protein [Bacteroidota bacterium]
MKSKHLLSGIAFMAFASSVFLIACNKSSSAENPSGSQNVSLYMTDGPGLFDNVYLDIKDVKVLVDTSSNTRVHDSCDYDRMGDREHHQPDSFFVWQDLNVKAGVYDLLQLRNGTDTLLAAANIKAGTIRMIRIDLGTNNSLVKDSVSYPLNLLPNAPSYVIIKLRGDEWEHHAPNSYRLWLDFDVQRSVIKLMDNKFYLRPFIKAFVVDKTGTVQGNVLPLDASPAIVTVYNSTDTAYGITSRGGMFKLRGLKDGTYNVFLNPSNGYKDTTITNVTISNASTVSLGSVTLHK